MSDSSDHLATRIAIYDLLVRYCRGLDRHDEELVLSVFEEDASITFYDGRSGLARDLVPELVKGVRGCESAQRTVSTCTVTINGDEAGSEAYFGAIYLMRRLPQPSQLIMFGGRYLDRLRRADGTWKITERVAVHDWDTAVPLSSDYPERDHWMGGRIHGAPSKSDLSYKVLGVGVGRATG